MSWQDVIIAKKENRHELILNGTKINKLISENGFDNAVFDLIALNYLNINDSNLNVLESDIAKLQNLQTLVLHSNKLEGLPSNIGDLVKLKVLDVSSNKLQCLPEEVAKLDNLTTLNASNNELIHLPSFAKNTKLSILTLTNNKLSTFPDVCYGDLSNLAVINVQGNLIEEVPNNLSTLQILKTLDVSSNKLKSVPGELADCNKIKGKNCKFFTKVSLSD